MLQQYQIENRQMCAIVFLMYSEIPPAWDVPVTAVLRHDEQNSLINTFTEYLCSDAHIYRRPYDNMRSSFFCRSGAAGGQSRIEIRRT